MYAVIESGGKQYRVQPGDVVQVEKLEGEPGALIKFDQVLFFSKADSANAEAKPEIWLGKPYLAGASVQGEVVGQGRGEKILIVKMKRRKQYRRTQGHRQFYTQLLITGVSNGAGENVTLSDADKKTRMSKFQSHLKPKGPAYTTPILVRRKPLTVTAASPGSKTETKKEASAHADKPAKVAKAPAAAAKAKKPAAKKTKA